MPRAIAPLVTSTGSRPARWSSASCVADRARARPSRTSPRSSTTMLEPSLTTTAAHRRERLRAADAPREPAPRRRDQCSARPLSRPALPALHHGLRGHALARVGHRRQLACRRERVHDAPASRAGSDRSARRQPERHRRTCVSHSTSFEERALSVRRDRRPVAGRIRLCSFARVGGEVPGRVRVPAEAVASDAARSSCCAKSPLVGFP